MSGREREPYVEGRVKTARQSGYYEVVGYDKLEVREPTAVDNLDYGTCVQIGSGEDAEGAAEPGIVSSIAISCCISTHSSSHVVVA